MVKLIYDLVMSITIGLFLMGCTTVKVKPQASYIIYEFPEKINLNTIIITDKKNVVDMCSPGMETWDSGDKIEEAHKHLIAACFNPSSGTMVLDVEHPEWFLHELCHAAGYPKSECASTIWPTLEYLTTSE